MRVGASEGIRTLDVHLGKVMLYQTELRSLAVSDGQVTENFFECKPPFPQASHPGQSLKTTPYLREIVDDHFLAGRLENFFH